MLLSLAPFSVLLAQTGGVRGRVRDEEGSAVFGATVRLSRSGSGTVLRVEETDRLGYFRFDALVAGSYTLDLGGFGYATVSRTVEVRPGPPVEIELSLARQAVEVEGITVGAERSRERIRFEEIGGVTSRELSLADLKQVPGVAEADPLRAIEVLPGVVSTSDFSADFHVRGGSQDQNLVLLDGMTIFSPFHLGGFFSVFNADMIDRVNLQSGGFPAKHGGRVSSVLEIDSDPGDGTFKVDGGISLLASRVTVSGAAPHAVARALGHSNVHWKVGARRSYFDWILKPVFDFPYHLQDFQGVVEGWTRSGDRLRLSAYTGDDVLDLTRLDPETFPLRINWNWGNDLLGARWTHPRGDGGSVDVHAGWSRFGTGLRFPDFEDTEFNSAIDQAQLRLDFQMRPSPAWRVDLGASAQRMTYDNLARTGGTDFAKGAGSGTLGGLYAEGAWSRQRAWVVEAGVRLDAWHPGRGDDVIAPAPRLAIKRFFSGGDGAVKLAAGRYTQFIQSIRNEELPLGIDTWVLAGDRLPHVVSDQIQLGVEGYPRPNLFVSVEGYARSFDGVITLNTADDPNDPLDDFLSGTGTSWGADLLVRKEGGTVNGWLSLSFLRATRTFPDVLSPFQPVPEETYAPIFDRRIDADLVLRLPLPWGWDGGVRWNVGTGTPYTRALGSYAAYDSHSGAEDNGRLRWSGVDASRDGAGYAVYLGGRNASRYPVYHRLDLSARKTYRKSWGTLIPYVDFLNVYNRRNVLFYFYEYSKSPPIRSGVSMFPLVPTFGLEVHW